MTINCKSFVTEKRIIFMEFCYGTCWKEMRKVKTNLFKNGKFRENRRNDSHALLQGVYEFLHVVSKLLKNNFAENRYKESLHEFRKNGLGEA
jgi:hypothetical protein